MDTYPSGSHFSQCCAKCVDVLLIAALHGIGDMLTWSIRASNVGKRSRTLTTCNAMSAACTEIYRASNVIFVLETERN